MATGVDGDVANRGSGGPDHSLGLTPAASILGGPFKVMQQDGLAGPLIQQRAHLLTLLNDKVAAAPTP